MPLGDDEQVRVGALGDVADRDEARRRVDVVALAVRAGRRGSRQAARIPSSVTAARAHADELADAARRRATASSRRRSRGRAGRRARRPRAELRAPARAARVPRERSRRRALRSFFTCGGTGSSRRRRRAGPRRVREDVHLRDPGARRRPRACARTQRSSSAGKPTITSVVRLKSASGSSRRRIRRRRVAPRHRAQHAVVARLERDVQVRARRSASRAARRRARSSTWLTSIDERRRRASPGVAPASRTRRGSP